MGKFFRKVASFFHNNPSVKTTIVGALGAAATAAASGTFGPKAAVIAGAVTAVAGLWTKRPVDATPTDKGQE